MSTEARRPVPPVRPPHEPSASLPVAQHRQEAREAGKPADAGSPASPPPPPASARFPDAPPAVGPGQAAQETTVRLRRLPSPPPQRPAAPPRPAWGPAPGTPATAAAPLPAHQQAHQQTHQRSGSPAGPQSGFQAHHGADGEGRDEAPGRVRGRLGAALACGLLGTGLLAAGVTAGVTGGPDGQDDAYAEARELWRTKPVDELFPPSVEGRNLGPGGADRTWNRIAVAPDSGCSDAFDPALGRTLSPVGCERLVRATYTDATGSHLVTVGLMFTEGDAEAMGALRSKVSEERLDRRTDQLPRPYAAEGTLAEGFGEEQRASWAMDVLTEAPVVVYAVSGWVDGRPVEKPVPAADVLEGATNTAAAQAGLGHDAGRLAGLFAQDLRKTVAPPRETPS